MSNGREIGTIVGGLVAAYFSAGTSYAALAVAAGSAAGGYVGGRLDPPAPTTTNRLEDIRVSVSAYGEGIPETWGSNIPRATWIWSSNIIQLGFESSSGGGKGGDSVSNTNYRQFMHGYISLGKTPPPGTDVQIRKIWVDGKLTYDASTGLSVGQALASADNLFVNVAVFPGFDDQVPHPIIESFEGIGNVPAFKGTIGVFIFALECAGGRIPQLQFELCINPSRSTEQLSYMTGPIYGDEDNPFPIWGMDANNIYQFEEYGSISGIRNGYLTLIGPGYVYRLPDVTADSGYYINNSYFVACSASPNGRPYALSRSLTGPTTAYPVRYFVLDLSNGSYTPITGEDGIPYANAVSIDVCASDQFNTENLMFVVADTLGTPVLWLPTGISFVPGQPAYALGAWAGIAYVMTGTGDVELWDYLGNYQSTIPAPMTVGLGTVSSGGLCVYAAGLYMYMSDAGISYFFKWTGTNWVTLGDMPGMEISRPRAATVFFCNDSYAIIGGGVSPDGVLYKQIRFNVVTPEPFVIGDFIESQSLRAGLEETQFDVSQMDDTIWGFTLQQPGSARANVAPLLTYAASGVTEEDGLMRYFHRADKTSVATITYDELGQVEDGSDSGDPFPLLRNLADELPRSVTVRFNNPYFDYQQSSQIARRSAVDSIMDEIVDLVMAMEPAQAATIARRILFERWLAQMTRSCSVSRKFVYLSAGDVIRVEYPRRTFTEWVVGKLNDTGVVLELSCYPSDGDLLIQTVPGSDNIGGQAITPQATPSRFVFGDWPIMQDSDNDTGIYIPMAGMASGWPGGELFVGADIPSLASRGTVENEATIGSAENALPTWDFNTVDEVNLLTVNTGHKTLASIDYETLLTGTENVAAVGGEGRWEIIKFRTATPLATGPDGGNRYELSGLMRGQRGTEWARGTHVAGDRFVLIGVAGTLRVNLSAGQIGQNLFYRAVTKGRSFDSAATEQYANTAEGAEPFAPTNLDRYESGSDIVLQWVRRTRLPSENWLAGSVPLGEASELFDVVLYTDGTFETVRRIIATTTNQATYTAAMQSADGYTTGPLYVKVSQISATNGRGHELQATI